MSPWDLADIKLKQRDNKVHMFVQHLRAGSYAAVIYGSGRVLMGRGKQSALSAFCRRTAILHIRQYSIYTVFTVWVALFPPLMCLHLQTLP